MTKFRAGFDLLKLRAAVEKNQDIQNLANYWEEFQANNPIQSSLTISKEDVDLLFTNEPFDANKSKADYDSTPDRRKPKRTRRKPQKYANKIRE